MATINYPHENFQQKLYVEQNRSGVSVATGVVPWYTSVVVNIRDIESVLAVWNRQSAWDTPNAILVTF